jgi:hypothetical protein
MTGRLDIGPRVAAMLRPEEADVLTALCEQDAVRCAVCGEWIAAESADRATLSLSVEGEEAVAQFAHDTCAPSQADLAELAAMADADPQGIAFSQALHPEAGAVLLWERRLNVRTGAPGDLVTFPYLHAQRFEGFHGALADEPVRLLPGLRLQDDGDDLVLMRGDEVVERFHGALEAPPPGWLEAVGESGFALLIVGASLQLRKPSAGAIQRAIRARRALMGLVEYAAHG